MPVFGDDRLSYLLLTAQVPEEWIPASDNLGKEIVDVRFTPSGFSMKFGDGTVLVMVDDKQSCCERRYLRTDDDLKSIIGSVFLDVIVKPVESAVVNGGSQDVKFIEFVTTKGSVVLSAHNDHNGYYGGFDIKFIV